MSFLFYRWVTPETQWYLGSRVIQLYASPEKLTYKIPRSVVYFQEEITHAHWSRKRLWREPCIWDSLFTAKRSVLDFYVSLPDVIRTPVGEFWKTENNILHIILLSETADKEILPSYTCGLQCYIRAEISIRFIEQRRRKSSAHVHSQPISQTTQNILRAHEVCYRMFPTDMITVFIRHLKIR